MLNMEASYKHKHLIGGEWVDSNQVIANINPSDLNDIVGLYASADGPLAHAAIDAAEQAFHAWSQTGIQQRCDILDRVGTELLARREELGRLLSREEGKTLPEGIGEIVRAGQIFKFQAQEALRNTGQVLDSVRDGLSVEVTHEPLGVVGIITPWNFPMAIPAWKIAPALAFGNTVVFKPAEAVPGCAWALADILHRSGIPAGVFNLVMGTGSEIGPTLTQAEAVQAISFTGSGRIAAMIAMRAAERGVRCQLEMGGKNPLVVLDDADLDRAVECAIQGAFYSTGQRCTASSRIIATPGIYAALAQRLTERTRALRVGHALDPNTQIGPVVDERQLAQDLHYLDIGRSEGATLACGGALLHGATPGHYLSPALFVDCDPRMRICREEIFGPIAALIPARDADEALALANDSPFGLSAGVCTTSLKHARHFQRHLRAGMVMVNAPTAGVDYHVPFGGMKASSSGHREQGSAARDFFTQIKTAYVCA
jgi:acyl-CoA reductase-like NAD-dependent aldehyde dehydrogenase